MATVPSVVLAAGASSRMGRPKPLLEHPAGGTALARVVAACREGGCAPVLVVTGAHHEAVAAEAGRCGAEVVENPAWSRGRSTSLKAALPHLPPGAAGLLVFPVDHFLVGGAVVRALREAFAASPATEVVLPTRDGRRGHPVLLAASLFPALASLGDDEPLRTVVRAPGRRTLELPAATDTVLRNIDRPEDL